MMATLVGGAFATKAEVRDRSEFFVGQDRTTASVLVFFVFFVTDRRSLLRGLLLTG